jgi:hypothetical protein
VPVLSRLIKVINLFMNPLRYTVKFAPLTFQNLTAGYAP